MKKFNINDHVKVKLNDFGKTIYYHQFDRFNDMCGKIMIEPKYPEVDEEGFTEMQLWQLMNIYGPHLANGCNVPFEGCVIYVRDEDLEESEC